MNVDRTALVPFRAEDMYWLVHDVNAYPKFLKWCTQAEVHEQSEDHQLASLSVSAAGISQNFTTHNTLVKGESVSMELSDGPFKSLQGQWTFTPLGEDGCKVRLSLDFEFSPGLLNAAFQKAFRSIADRLVQEFCQRAEQVIKHD